MLYVVLFQTAFTLCKRPWGIIARFWWSHEADSTGICWTGKEHLCRDKFEGGMNFRDLCIMKDALLAKLFWSMAENPSSLVSRTFKARYHRNLTIGLSSIGFSPLFGLERDLDGWNETE